MFTTKKRLIACLALSVATTAAVASVPLPPLAENHKAQHITCNDCHGTGAKAAVHQEKCLECHGSYEQVAVRTKDMNPNPHDSHIPDLDCTKCHHSHKPGEIYCLKCHQEMQFERKSAAH